MSPAAEPKNGAPRVYGEVEGASCQLVASLARFHGGQSLKAVVYLYPQPWGSPHPCSAHSHGALHNHEAILRLSRGRKVLQRSLPHRSSRGGRARGAVGTGPVSQLLLSPRFASRSPTHRAHRSLATEANHLTATDFFSSHSTAGVGPQEDTKCGNQSDTGRLR